MDWLIHWIITLNILILLQWNWNWVEGALSGYNETPTQYHIQTDEGPERFFRFQTFNGQYRKERRLDDGTVLGSYGWVDPAGFLRMTDYIADGKGYRVLKSRMEYVGVKAIPEVEVKKQKQTPMKHSTRVLVAKNPIFLNALESVVVPQVSKEGPKPTESPYDTPTTFSPKLYETVKPLPKLLFQTPTPTPSPRFYVRSTPTTQTPQKLPAVPSASVTALPKIYVRSLVNEFKENNANAGTPKPSVPGAFARRPTTQNIFRAAETRPELISILPINRFRPSPLVQNNQNTGETNAEKIDVFRNYTTPLRRGTGFVYKIPNQYHQDETQEDGSRMGSFGYVDPFGIRRVIHYNAGRNGFQHSKDFKFVGKQDGN
jgi:hypothetical protein